MAVQDDTSILSTAGGGEADITGIPRSSQTGEIVAPAPTGPVTTHTPLGVPQSMYPNPQPGTPDAMSTPVGPPPGSTPEEQAEAKRKADLAKAIMDAGAAAGVPVSLFGICVPGASVKGRKVPPFTGDPDVPVLPGTDVIYWTQQQGNPAYMVPYPMTVLEPVMGGIAPNEHPTGAYRGACVKSQQNMTRVMHAGRPSRVPKLAHFTPAGLQWPPEMCRLDAKANTEDSA